MSDAVEIAKAAAVTVAALRDLLTKSRRPGQSVEDRLAMHEEVLERTLVAFGEMLDILIERTRVDLESAKVRRKGLKSQRKFVKASGEAVELLREADELVADALVALSKRVARLEANQEAGPEGQG